MQIKTIWNHIGFSALFDNAVNEALDDGWRLSRREFLPGDALDRERKEKYLLYAELVKVDPLPEQPAMDPLEAVQVLARTCEAAPHCEPDSCPLHDWCTTLGDDPVPKDWKLGPKKQ